MITIACIAAYLVKDTGNVPFKDSALIMAVRLGLESMPGITHCEVVLTWGGLPEFLISMDGGLSLEFFLDRINGQVYQFGVIAMGKRETYNIEMWVQ